MTGLPRFRRSVVAVVLLCGLALIGAILGLAPRTADAADTALPAIRPEDRRPTSGEGARVPVAASDGRDPGIASGTGSESNHNLVEQSGSTPLDIPLAVLATAFILVLARIATGPTLADRIVAAELGFVIVVCALIVLGARLGSIHPITVAMISALLQFVATAALAELLRRKTDPTGDNL